MPEDTLLALFREAFGGTVRWRIRTWTAEWLDSVPNPFREMVAFTKQEEREDFGSGPI